MIRISVIGSGTMGNGIAHVFALKGYEVNLVDINLEILGKAMLTINKNLDRQVSKNLITRDEKEVAISNIHPVSDLGSGVDSAGLVIEAVSENFSLKSEVFKNIDHLAPPAAVLASNTSSISITKLASLTGRPDRVIGMHFMNPVPVMKLVEIVRGSATTYETVQMITGIAKTLDKLPVTVNDYPGFVSNRVLMPMINEAIEALQEGVAGVEEIDTIMKLGMSHPMGPLQLADLIGLDVCMDIMNVLLEGFGNPKYAPCPLLISMVKAGNLGVKTGIGFYDYKSGSTGPAVSRQFLKKS